MASWRIVFALAASAAIAAAQVPNLSGTWQLDVQKSAWGKHPKPTGGTVVIEHHEPALKYTGTVAVEHGSETADTASTFSFDGVIDGKPYPVKGTDAVGTMSIRRVNPTTTISELKSGNGTILETSRMTLSADGKRLVREVKAPGPGGEVSWTEVYERK